MGRFILEDIKLNKDRRPTPSREKIIQPQVETSFNENIYEKDISVSAQGYDETREKKQELRINEYLTQRNTTKQRLQRTPQIKTKSKLFHKPVIILFFLSLIAGGIYWGGNYFQKADITITSKQQTINYQQKPFIASKDINEKGVDFEIMIVSDKKSKKIILTEPQDVSMKAKGSVTLYNEFSTTPQKILKGTFLADSTGKTYQIDSTITLPGYKIDTDKKIIKGEIEANITAFLPGEAYNKTSEDFYITSFKKTTKYNKIYGKLKTPLTNGAQGLVYVLDEKNKNTVDNIAQTSFKDELFQKVKALVPPGYILYPSATTFSYTIDNNVISSIPETEISIEGNLSVVILREQSLVENIIKTSLPQIKGDEVEEINILDLNKLSFAFTNNEQLITKDMTSIPFSLTGDIYAVWKPNVELLKTKLIGIKKDNVLPIFKQDPGISSAFVKIFPPWQQYIPSNVTKLNIILK